MANDVILGNVRQNKLLIIAPPASAKSTWNSLIRTTFHLGNHPDESLLFFTSSDPMAKIFHSPVEAALRENEKHRWTFPDQRCRPSKRGWSSDGLYLRGVPVHQKDPSFRAVGFGATVMGARSDGNLIDDPMNQEDAQSEVEVRKAKSYVDKTVIPRLKIDKRSWMIATMTRWGEADLASHFIELAGSSGDWLYCHSPQIATNDPVPDFMGRSDGELLWPEIMHEAYIEGERRRLSIAEFNLIHQGDATGMGGDIFSDEKWFQPLPENFWSEILGQCIVLQAWDMAFSEKKTACYSVGITVAVDPQMNMYILHVARKKYLINDLEEEMVENISISRPLIVAIETDRFHQETIRVLARKILSRLMCNIQLITPKDDKISRARLPAARAQNGKVFINRNNAWWRPFVSECLGFPNTRYKDQVDAFSLVTHIAQLVEERWETEQGVSQVETAMS